MCFLESLKIKNLSFSDFNEDTLKIKEPKNIITYLGPTVSKNRNFIPAAVTPTSTAFIDQMIRNEEYKTKFVKTTISDHFAAIAEKTLTLKKCKQIGPIKNPKPKLP